jgi:serine/threonine-protein kinase RsbW
MTFKDIIVEIKEIPGTKSAATIIFQGELTSHSNKVLFNAFNQLEDRSSSFVIADMSMVSQISSAALGVFMGVRKRLIEKGGDLVFAAMPLDLKEKLNLMGANKIFKFHADIRSAINAYKWEFEQNPEHLHLKFPPFLEFIPSVRSLVSGISKQKGYGNRDLFRIEMIVDEICNNAIEHGLREQNKFIDLKIKIDAVKVEIDVASVSDPKKISSLKALFQSSGVHSPERKSDEKRGRGLALIKMLSNELSVDSNESGTIVHVTKLREE